MSLEAAAKQLEEVAAGLRRGFFTISNGKDAVKVTFPASVDVMLEAEFNPAKSKWSVDLGIEWKTK